MKIQKYLQTNGVYMRASGITLVSGPLVTITPQYTPIAPTTAKDGRGIFIHTKEQDNINVYCLNSQKCNFFILSQAPTQL